MICWSSGSHKLFSFSLFFSSSKSGTSFVSIRIYSESEENLAALPLFWDTIYGIFFDKYVPPFYEADVWNELDCELINPNLLLLNYSLVSFNISVCLEDWLLCNVFRRVISFVLLLWTLFLRDGIVSVF